MNRWIDDDGTLLRGKHRNELVEDVARDDPSWLRWAVDTVEDMDEGDRDVMTAALAYRHRSNGRR